MPLYASTFQWPDPVIRFVSLFPGARDGDAELVEKGDRWILKAPGHFSVATGQSGQRIRSTTLDGEPALIQGSVFAIDGDLGLRVDELLGVEPSRQSSQRDRDRSLERCFRAAGRTHVHHGSGG